MKTWLESNPEPSAYVPVVIKSNNLTIEWVDDATGDWV